MKIKYWNNAFREEPMLRRSCILSVASRNLRLSYQITKWHINAAYITVTYIVLIRKAWGKNFSLVKLECFHTKVEHFCSAHTRVVAPFHIFYIRKKVNQNDWFSIFTYEILAVCFYEVSLFLRYCPVILIGGFHFS